MHNGDCGVTFLDCEYADNGYCTGCCTKDRCTEGLLHSRYSEAEIKLAVDDAHKESYIRGLQHIEKLIYNLNEGGGIIEPTMQSWWKFLRQNRMMVVPFDQKKVDGDSMIFIVDLKRYKYSSLAIPKHSKQLHLYALSVKQQYNFAENPYFTDIIYRPFSTEVKGMYRGFKPHLSIIKSNGELENEFIKGLDNSYALQERILQSAKQFTDYKCKKSRFCPGCFMNKMCNGIESILASEKCTLEEYLVDEIKALERPYTPRGSSVGYLCDINKILSVVNKDKLPPEILPEERDDSRVGDILHTSFNDQHRNDFIHNQMLKEKLGLQPVSRKEYCESKTLFKRDNYQIKGKADAILMLVKK